MHLKFHLLLVSAAFNYCTVLSCLPRRIPKNIYRTDKTQIAGGELGLGYQYLDTQKVPVFRYGTCINACIETTYCTVGRGASNQRRTLINANTLFLTGNFKDAEIF
jgi:hypothetical protein